MVRNQSLPSPDQPPVVPAQDRSDPTDVTGTETRMKLAAGRRIRGRRRKRRRLTLAVLPTLLTLSNGACGLAAIAVATSDNLPWQDETKLLVAGVLIFGGMLFDALDGSAARMTNAASRFGAELDSLCDAITFGTVPAVIVWRYCDGWALPQKLSWAIGALFALCVLIRLARYNAESSVANQDEEESGSGFEGLPSPAAAGTIGAFAIALPELTAYANGDYPESIRWLAVQFEAMSQYFIATLTLTLAYLMVSRFHYAHVFRQLIQGRRTPQQIGQAMFIVIGALVFNWLALPIALCYYAFAPPARSFADISRRRLRPTPESDPKA